MKKIITFIIAGIMTCSMVACGDTTSVDTEGLDSTVEDTTTESETTIEDTTTVAQESETTIEETTAEEPTTEAPAEETTEHEGQTFYLNTSSKKIHYDKCPLAGGIRFSNLNVFWGTKEEVLGMEGYTWCKSCVNY